MHPEGPRNHGISRISEQTNTRNICRAYSVPGMTVATSHWHQTLKFLSVFIKKIWALSVISAFYCNTSTWETRLMQMLCQGFQSHLYWATILNNTTITVRCKSTNAFLGKMICCWIGARGRRIRTKCRFFALLYSISGFFRNLAMADDSTQKSIASVFVGTHLPTPAWNQTPQLMICIRQHKQASQSCLPLPICQKLAFRPVSFPSLCWQKSSCSYRAKQIVELIWTKPNTLPLSPSQPSFLWRQFFFTWFTKWPHKCFCRHQEKVGESS